MMSVFKKIKDQILEDYNSYKSYFFVKLIIILLMSGIVVLSLFDAVLLVINNATFYDIVDAFRIPLIFIVFWYILNGIVELIFFPAGKIEDNMKNLPNDVSGKRIIVEYNLPKEITPSEAAILLYGRSELSNLLSIVYGWVNSKIVDIYTKDGKKYIKPLHTLGRNYPLYEGDLFSSLFKGKDEENIGFNRGLLNQYKVKVNDMIVMSCEEKGYIVKSEGTVRNKFISKVMKFLVPCFLIIMGLFCFLALIGGKLILGIPLFVLLHIFLYVRKINKEKDKEITKAKTTTSISLILFIAWLLCFVYFIIGKYLLGCLMLVIIFLVMYIRNQNKSYDIELTDKGKKILGKIYGYKYYLENCEEDEINSNLGENEVYTKHLPGAVALKLNWKIIDKLC